MGGALCCPVSPDASRDEAHAELDEFATELTETLPPDDPMIVEVRHWLRRMRDAARAADNDAGA